MKAVIMAGGFGTRLRPLTFETPKPMVPVLNKPVMQYNVELLIKHKIDKMIFTLYYQPETIRDYFGDGSRFGANFLYVMANEDLGTAGSVRNAVAERDDKLIILSGDVLTDIDLGEAIKFHNKKKAMATLVLTRVDNPLAYGIVITGEDGKISRFLEKPGWGEVFSDTINTGIYILNHEVLDWVPEDEEFDFSNNLFPELLKAGKPLYGYIADGYWRDIGNHHDYKLANKDALKGLVNIEFPGEKIKFERGEAWVESGVRIDETAILKGSVIIGKDSRIDKKVILEDTVIGSNTQVHHSSHIERSIIWNNVEVGERSEIYEATIASGVQIERSAWVQENVVISSGCRIGEEAQINPNVKIWPDKEVSDRAILASSLVWGERWSGGLFANSRVTGIIIEEIPPEFASKLGASFGAYVGNGASVAISWDADRASQMTANALISGLLSAGASVIKFGLLPIPIVRFALNQSEGGAGGIHVRKAPRDQRLQDLIFFNELGHDLTPAARKKIERLYAQEDFPRAKFNQIGSFYSPKRIASSYMKKFISKIDKNAIKKGNFSVVIDYDFGGAADILPIILTNFDCKVTSLNGFVDTRQITTTRKEREKKLNQLSLVVKALGANIGFMIDPSGEKLYILSEEGRLLDFHEELYLGIKLLLSTEKVTGIGVPISSTIGVHKLAHKYNAKIVYTKNDHHSMIETAVRENIDLVGGTRGGFIFTEFSFACDAMFSIVKILELLGKSGASVEQIMQDMPQLHRGMNEIRCPWRSKGKVMRKLIEHTSSNYREIIDGVRLFFDDAWILVLPDPEKPVFILEAEATQKDRMQKLLTEYSELVEKWQNL